MARRRRRATGDIVYGQGLEGRYSGEEAELEEKIIIGQRHGDWKWALHLGHSTEWANDLHDREGERQN